MEAICHDSGQGKHRVGVDSQLKSMHNQRGVNTGLLNLQKEIDVPICFPIIW